MFDPYMFQYQITSFFATIPQNIAVILFFIAGIIAFKFRTALAIGGAILAFLLASGYLVFIY
jgi:hypothetical protein